VSLGFNPALFSDWLQSLVSRIDGPGPAGGAVQLFSGTRPVVAGGDPPAGAALQCSIALARPCGVVAGGVLAFSTDGIEGVRVDDKTITWARFVDAAGTPWIDADASLGTGTGDVRLTNVDGFIGGFVRISSGGFSF